MSIDRRKQSILLPADTQAELRAEAARLDRPIAWVMQWAVRLAMPALRRLPAPGGASRSG